jgi:hypothetical protein
MMRRVTERIGVFCVIGLLLLGSACSLKSVRKDSGTEPNGSETTATKETTAATVTPKPTSRPTAKPTEKPTQTPRPTAKPTQKATPTPEPLTTPTTISLEDYDAEKAFLMKDVTAKDIMNNILQLKAGQMIWLYRTDPGNINEKSRFFLPTDDDLSSETPSDNMLPARELFFDVSKGVNGVICIDGIPEHLLFGTESTLFLDKLRVVEVDPWVHQRGISSDERYVMNIDWNRDGINDEVWVRVYNSYPFQVLVYFKDGKDGHSIRKEIRLSENEDDPDLSEDGCLTDYIESDNLLLLQKPSGEYVIMISGEMAIVSCCGDTSKTGALVFDPEQGFDVQVLEDIYEYKDDVLYRCSIDGVFGNCYSTTRQAVRLKNDLTCETVSDTEYYTNNSFIYTLQDVNVEIESSSGYVPSVIKGNTAVIPEKIESNFSGQSDEFAVYFLLSDGQRCRIRMRYSKEDYEYYTVFEERPLEEFFPMYYGG